MSVVQQALNLAPTDSVNERIVSLLWPQSAYYSEDFHVYCIVDGARDAQIYPLLQSSPSPHQCLYLDPLTDKLRAAAPHIVKLRPHAYFTQQLLKQSWGNSGSIFLIVPSMIALPQIAQHCRKLNRVEGPSGEVMLFRYYDPRILRTYLPSCTDDELHTVFGPIDEIVMENESASQLLRFCRNDNEHTATPHFR